ncbi:MAG: BatD family protein [Endomicrobiaceae bacterium]|nr:BatD family protein [Endomicrobiaceae bacterium]
MKRFRQLFCVITICFISTAFVYANKIEMYSSVNKTSVALNETLQLTISIKGDSKSLPYFSAPTLKDFNTYGSSQSKSMSIVNGQVTNTVSYIYTLSPKKEGEYEIPSFKLDYDGQTYETEPIKITVSQAQTVSSVSVQNTQMPQQKQSSQVYNFDTSKAVFVEAKVNKKTAYINEKIIYTFSFYTSINLLSNPSYQAPSFIGFFTGNTTQNNYRIQINGRDYVVTEVSTELYPQQEGNIKIDRSTLMVSIEDFSKNYDDFFASFFRRSKNVELVTDEINIKVSKVPQNIGMVGNFKMSATVDKKDKKENEPFDLKITISGDGNIRTIQEPEIMLSDNLKKYETSEKIIKQGDKETGKEFTTLIMPLSSGEGEIKILSQKYFDIQTKQVKNLPAKSIKVNVLEDLSVKKSSDIANGIVENNKDFHGDNDITGQVQPNIDISVFIKIYEFIKKPVLWIILGSLLLLYILVRLIIKYIEYINKDQQKLKNKKAYKKSKKYFQKAKKTKVATEFYEYMYKGLLEYFASVLGQSADGLTAYKIRKELEQKSVNADLIKQIEEIIDDCSIVLYSQNSSNNETNLREFYNKTFDVLKQLDI